MNSEVGTNPLAAFSLTGRGNELTAKAQADEPLLGSLCLKGETSVWYAPPNTGKTLIVLALAIEAVAAKRIEADKVFYLNADDTGFGLATKVQILDDLGIHCLAPGHNGLKLSNLVPALEAMARDGTAHGSLIIIDTLKKVADLMSKRQCRDFGKATRAFSMAGGTLLGLAHTNKNRSSTEKLIYAGTTDIVEDFDSAYILEGVTAKDTASERLVRFERIKARGDNAANDCYGYSAAEGLSYLERLTSVRQTDPEFGDEEPEAAVSEEDLLFSIFRAIECGTVTKMRLVTTVSKALRISKRKVLAVIEQHTGPDPAVHRWDFERVAHGAHRFFVHPKPEAPDATA